LFRLRRARAQELELKEADIRRLIPVLGAPTSDPWRCL